MQLSNSHAPGPPPTTDHLPLPVMSCHLPAELSEKDLKHSPVDNLLWGAHQALTSMEPMRAAVGAGANTRDNPQRIIDYDPVASDVGGLFDRRAAKPPAAAAASTDGGASVEEAAAAAAAAASEGQPGAAKQRA